MGQYTKNAQCTIVMDRPKKTLKRNNYESKGVLPYQTRVHSDEMVLVVVRQEAGSN